MKPWEVKQSQCYVEEVVVLLQKCKAMTQSTCQCRGLVIKSMILSIGSHSHIMYHFITHTLLLIFNLIELFSCQVQFNAIISDLTESDREETGIYSN